MKISEIVRLDYVRYPCFLVMYAQEWGNGAGDSLFHTQEAIDKEKAKEIVREFLGRIVEECHISISINDVWADVRVINTFEGELYEACF